MSDRSSWPEIRAFRREDRDAVMALAPRLTLGVASWRDPDAVLRSVTEWVQGSIATVGAPNHAVFVAVLDEQVVGVVSVGLRQHFTGEEDAYVGELVVDSGTARAGIGTALMAAAEDWGRARGLTHLTLETGAANAAAISFYRALGYDMEDVRLTRRL
ncbi:MAG: GNAT family N-acetyltransferase [Nocardioides sp.]